MKKYMQKVLAYGMIVAILFVGAGSAIAASLTSDSDAEVEFTTSTGADALYLEAVPALDFGNRELQVADWYYAAISTSTPLEIHDRRGMATGWNVTVSLEEFKDSTATVGLEAAEIR